MSHPKMQAHRVYAWIGQDNDGCEGILMFRSEQNGALLPMVSTEESIVDAMRFMAEDLQHLGGFLNVRKVAYDWAEVIERI